MSVKCEAVTFPFKSKDCISYTLVTKDGKSYIRENFENFDIPDIPVCLNEYGNLAEAQEIYLKLQSCSNCHVAYVYRPFQVTGKNFGYVAALERGTSLQSFLTPENVETLFDINALTQRPYQASSRYKRIITGLVVAGKMLIKKGLICSFNLGTIFLMKTYAEVTDFYSGEGSQLWRGLLQCLCDINSRNPHYIVENDSEMTEVLNLLQALSNPDHVEMNRYVDKLLKSTFFWHWSMKNDLVCKMGQLLELKHFKPLIMDTCRYSFPTNWIERVRGDSELDKLFVLYRKIIENKIVLESIRSERQFHLFDFIRCIFSHYYVMRRNIEEDTCEEFGIENHEALHKRLEWCLGDCAHLLLHRLISELVPLENFPYARIQRFVNASICESYYRLDS